MFTRVIILIFFILILIFQNILSLKREKTLFKILYLLIKNLKKVVL